MKADDAYKLLKQRSRDASILASCLALLDWDEMTYMPSGGAESRSEQIAHLTGLYHDQLADPRVGEWLAIVGASQLVADPDSTAVANVRHWRRLHERAARVPRELAEEIARAASLGTQVWQASRQENDYANFRLVLERIVALRRAEARHVAPGIAEYDVMLDENEPGLTVAQLAPLFAALRNEVVPLREKIAASKARPKGSLWTRDFPVDRQRVFCESMAEAIGYDFQKGRLDATAHPFFASIGRGDVRITTRYHGHDLRESVNSTLHEMGHALYEQGVDPAEYGTPAGDSGFLALHESQSRLWENKVGRSRPFWQHFFPLARRIFHEVLQEVKLDQFHRALNQVQPGPIRVGSDEVTYDMHILVRFELEQMLIGGTLDAADLPDAWAAKYREHLGITPPDDALGCLQDSHWGSGTFGCFPAYTLGNLLAAQLFAKADADLGGTEKQISKGDFAPLLEWLRQNVHRHGQRYDTAELILRATGSPPSHAPLVQQLVEKYSALYSL